MINVDDRLIRTELKAIGVDAFAILMCITTHLGKSSTAWPGVNRLREMTGLSKERAYNAIKKLVECGMVERWQENENGVWGKVVYRVTTQYLNIYVSASTFSLSEPLAGKPEYGYPEYGKPETGNTAHISINNKEVINKEEVINKREESAPANLDFFNPNKHEETAAHLISHFEKPENAMWLNGMANGNWKRAVKGYCLKLQKLKKWNDLQVPKNEGQHYIWAGEMLAGIKSWYTTAAEIDRSSGRQADAITIKAIPNPQPPRPTVRASAAEARKLAGYE